MMKRKAVASAWLCAALVATIGLALAGKPATVRSTMRFASDMARQGNWREARYRWEQIDRGNPDLPEVLNNLAVTLEVLGRSKEAGALYRRAAALSTGNLSIEENVQRHAYFWSRVQAAKGDDDEEPEADEAGEPVLAEQVSGKKKKKGKTAKVVVSLPVPPKIEVADGESLLVTKFRVTETNLLDTNREMVRFLRGEFRKDTDLKVLDITPAPAIPEQTIPDLLANLEFWKHLGRNYDADLIVSGVVKYDREDASSFRDVDVVSSTTGQKVRTTQFVEQEQFIYQLDIFFIDGATGDLRYRDRLQRGVIFQGLQNDPYAAFYDISDSIAVDVVAVITGRTRQDTRVIFKQLVE